MPPARCDASYEAEEMESSTGEAVEGGWNIYTQGTLTTSHEFTGGETTLVVHARGSVAGGTWPHMVVKVGSTTVDELDVDAEDWTEYEFELDAPAGEQEISIEFTNDGAEGEQDRNLYIDKVEIDEYCEPYEGTGGGTGGGGSVDGNNPFAGATLYVDPNSTAAQSGVSKIASNPVASWVGDWSPGPGSTVSGLLDAAGSQLRVLVAYNIYNRDCGGHSGGGVSNAEQYLQWITSFAEGIGDHKVAVILEPDALVHDCDQSRWTVLADAVEILKRQPNAYVYIDAGHDAWKPAGEMASRLQTAGIAQADGFALNISNFRGTQDLIGYGMQISGGVGNKPFVIDTSRNGVQPPPSDWCNPPDRGLGERPTADTGNDRVHAFLWIKAPGESDGNCNGGPAAGQWWQEYAQGLADRAVF